MCGFELLQNMWRGAWDIWKLRLIVLWKIHFTIWSANRLWLKVRMVGWHCTNICRTKFNQNLVTATRTSQSMACFKIGFGMVENCVNLFSLTSLVTLLCRIKRNMPESVGSHSRSHTEGGDPHLERFIFLMGRIILKMGNLAQVITTLGIINIISVMHLKNRASNVSNALSKYVTKWTSSKTPSYGHGLLPEVCVICALHQIPIWWSDKGEWDVSRLVKARYHFGWHNWMEETCWVDLFVCQ